MKKFSITIAVSLVLLGGGGNRPAFCDERRTADETVKAADSPANSGVAALPSNVTVPNNMKRVLQSVWKRSPTFRQQCRRIDEARNLRIEIWVVPQLPIRNLRALSIVRKSGDGIVKVNMKIRAPGDYVEIIAHEFEHMLEQLEGLDLKSLAAEENSGVSRNELDAYETERAVNAGRRVFDEYRRGHSCNALSEARHHVYSPKSCD